MNGRMVTGERASGRTSKKSVVLRWASAAEGLWTVQGEFGGHDEFRGNLGRVVVVEERVTSVGVFLDVVIDADVGRSRSSRRAAPRLLRSWRSCCQRSGTSRSAERESPSPLAGSPFDANGAPIG